MFHRDFLPVPGSANRFTLKGEMSQWHRVHYDVYYRLSAPNPGDCPERVVRVQDRPEREHYRMPPWAYVHYLPVPIQRAVARTRALLLAAPGFRPMVRRRDRFAAVRQEIAAFWAERDRRRRAERDVARRIAEHNRRAARGGGAS